MNVAKKILRVGITYDLKKDFSHREDQPIDSFEEFDSEETIDAVRDVLQSEGHKVFKLGGGAGLIDRLRTSPVDIVFNIAEGIGGRNREAHIPALLEFLNIPYTGSDPLTLSLTLDKAMAKKVVRGEGIPTPGFQKVEKMEDLHGLDLRYPLFVKLCYEGSSKGVRLDSKISDPSSLREKVGWLLETYGPPVLVEEFVSGPEFTVGILGNSNPSVLGVMQIEIKGSPPDEAIYSLEVKREWEKRVRYHCPPPIPPRLLKSIEEVALRAYRALDCRDVSRVDIRIGGDGIPYFLEVNPLPGLSPVYGDLPIMAGRMGWEYSRLVKTIFHHALKRYGMAG
ncbi:MAG: ATP-grasp domain-containing protein [Thermodesulfobacteriota bacterium]|nr:ATP-grasp domain-containing protein [Thermodesulfobacteriota bacterium]